LQMVDMKVNTGSLLLQFMHFHQQKKIYNK
jgi:hypothetical protein